MIRSVLGKLMWLGRTTSALVGLVVLFALAIGAANSALAHTTVDNKLFHLGHNNPVERLSALTGTLTGAILKLDNNGTGHALQLEVAENSAPLKVNAAAGTASDLSADELDGRDSSEFALALHDHDSRYYTETEVDTRLSDKANVSHQHSGTDITSGEVADARIAQSVARDAEVPQIVRNNDGQGSGIDADVLDGRDSSTYLPGNLPSGTTLRGTFGEVDVAQSTAYSQYAAISFGYSVSPAPTAHYVRAGDPTPAGCTGNAANPGAQPGHLCNFETDSFNLTFRNVFHVQPGGAVVVLGAAGANTYYAYGTWAVTAP